MTASAANPEPTSAAPNGTVPASPARTPRTLREAWPIFARHASPRLLMLAVAVAVALRLAVGGFSAWDLLPAVAIFALWPIQEWLIHVFVLHYKPVRAFGRTLDFAVPRSHRAHHRDPWNVEILFIPLHSYLYTIPLLVLLWGGATRDVGLALTGIACHLALAVHYEAVHFLVHTRVSPRPRFYQRLWRNHRLHHFKNERFWYGVTRLEADRWLGTAPASDEVPLSPTARTLVGPALPTP